MTKPALGIHSVLPAALATRRWPNWILPWCLGAALSLPMLPPPATAGPEASRTVIHAGSEIDFPPYAIADASGRASGFSVELLRAVADAAGLDVEVATGPWSEVLAGFKAGRYDVLPLVALSPQRADMAIYTRPHTQAYDCFFVRKGSPPIDSIKGAEGREVIVMGSDAAHEELLRSGVPVRIIETTTIPDAMRLLASGRHDAVLVPKLLGQIVLKDAKLEKLIVPGTPVPDYNRQFAMAVRPGDIELRDRLDRGIAAVHASGRYGELYREWFRAAEEPQAFPWYIVAWIGGSSLLLVVMASGWIRSYRQQKELAQAESRFRGAFHYSGIGIALVSPEGKWLRVNPACCAMLGYSEAELLGMTFQDITFKDDLDADLNQLRRMLAGEIESYSMEKRYSHKQGTIVWALLTVSLVRNAGGSVLYFVSQIQDITERKRAEEDLRRSENRFRAIAANTPDHILIQDGDLRYTYVVNPQLGLTVADMIGKTDHDLLDAEDAERLTAIKRKVLDSGEPIYMEVPLQNSRGDVEYFDSVSMPKTDAEGNVDGIIGYFRNVTERKRAEAERAELEAQLYRAQKLESVGRLAGGVAHDFNNMLGVILGYAELGLMREDLDPAVRAELTEIRKAAERSAGLTRQLLAFARRQPIVPRVLAVNDSVAGLLKMLQRMISENVRLLWEPSPAVWEIKMDPSQFDQMLANLCINARDAIVDTGRITIETANAVIDAAYCASHVDAAPGEYVRITVSDDGQGMTADVLAHIFEPFYTTKELGKGTGLGLATVYGSVAQNNGFISVSSEPGCGTTFSVHIPRHGAVEPVAQGAGGDAALPHGTETILVVEDEEVLLDLARALLELLGYRVLPAGTASEALRLVHEHGSAIDLLLTDVIMPEMNGKELADRVRHLQPAIRLMFMSGYTADVLAPHGVFDDDTHFIPKPFRFPELAARVREVLDGE